MTQRIGVTWGHQRPGTAASPTLVKTPETPPISAGLPVPSLGLLYDRRVERTLIADLQAKVGESVRVRGWVHAVRDQKRMQFVILRDETGLAQLVLEKGDPPSELNRQVSELTAESAVTIVGEVAADERVKLGGIELRLQTLRARLPRGARAAGHAGVRAR